MTIGYFLRLCLSIMAISRVMKLYQITMIAMVVLLATGCDRENTADNQDLPLDSLSLPDSEISGATIQFFEASILTTEIHAETIRKYELIDSTMAYVVDISIMDSAGNITSHIVGDSGVIREQKRHIDIFGHVVVVSADSIRLETEYLFWNSAKGTIETDAFVTLSLGEDVQKGYGMLAKDDFSSFKILNEVSGRIKIDKETLK